MHSWLFNIEWIPSRWTEYTRETISVSVCTQISSVLNTLMNSNNNDSMHMFHYETASVKLGVEIQSRSWAVELEKTEANEFPFPKFCRTVLQYLQYSVNKFIFFLNNISILGPPTFGQQWDLTTVHLHPFHSFFFTMQTKFSISQQCNIPLSLHLFSNKVLSMVPSNVQYSSFLDLHVQEKSNVPSSSWS